VLKRLDQVPKSGKSVQKRHVELGFLAILGRNRNGFRQRAGSKSFFTSLLVWGPPAIMIAPTDVLGASVTKARRPSMEL